LLAHRCSCWGSPSPWGVHRATWTRPPRSRRRPWSSFRQVPCTPSAAAGLTVTACSGTWGLSCCFCTQFPREEDDLEGAATRHRRVVSCNVPVSTRTPLAVRRGARFRWRRLRRRACRRPRPAPALRRQVPPASRPRPRRRPWGLRPASRRPSSPSPAW